MDAAGVAPGASGENEPGHLDRSTRGDSAMALMPPQDSMFLIPESREQPMHVGSLQLFELPSGADRSLIRDPDNRSQPSFWEPALHRRRSGNRGGGSGLLSVPSAVIDGVADMVKLTPKALRIVERGLRQQQTMLPMQAPRSMLNVPIT